MIAYLVVLLMIGKPLYFLEMILGQFSSYGSVKVWSVVPFAKGIKFYYKSAILWLESLTTTSHFYLDFYRDWLWQCALNLVRRYILLLFDGFDSVLLLFLFPNDPAMVNL